MDFGNVAVKPLGFRHIECEAACGLMVAHQRGSRIRGRQAKRNCRTLPDFQRDALCLRWGAVNACARAALIPHSGNNWPGSRLNSESPP